MPTWGTVLSPLQIGDLLALIDQWRAAARVVAATPAATQAAPQQVRPSNSGGPGAALNLAGNVTAGQEVFVANCQKCHGPQGQGGVNNLGSGDGTVPPLNPIDSTLANTELPVFAFNIDLFLEHGSTPSGSSPQLTMPAWGDKKTLTDQQIADVMAYVISLNPTAPVTGTSTAPAIVRPSNPGGPGVALDLSGNATSGQDVFVANCVKCHGPQGQGGVNNPGSSDGTVPPLNPIDSTIANTDALAFAYNVDLFLEHGSTPAGSSPQLTMPAWGDQKKLTAQQIADVIAYVITLNPAIPVTATQAAATEPAATATQSVTATPAPATSAPTTSGPTPTGAALQQVRPSNPGAQGPALKLTGNSTTGQTLFVANCQKCHGPQGQGAVSNPGSSDGTVPPLNPIDPTLANSEQAVFAFNIDLFLEHGSTPAGSSPQLTMPAWGDQQKLTPQQIADVMAYVISLNTAAGTPTPSGPAIVRPSNSGGPGQALNLTSNSTSGQMVYIANCQKCHGPQGQGGVNNPGSSDGTVPPLNPIDSTIANTDALAFAYNVDLFLEHGSTPAGSSPQLTMPAWGDQKKLTAQQIADVIAYVITLNPAIPVTATQAAATEPAATATQSVTATPAPATSAPTTSGPTPTGAALQQVRPSNPGAQGPALKLTGNSTTGQTLFVANCQKCHGPQGQGAVSNPGSSDGTVPPLNPIDPTLANSEQAVFAFNIDLFLEHGSTPAGSSPQLTMPAWGDQQKLTPQQIADVMAYVISLNTAAGTPTPSGPAIVRPSNSGGPGQALNLTSNSTSGQMVYIANCQKCHGPQGQGGVNNPGSSDGTVPPLNPIDPTIVNSDPLAFAYNVDLFIEHGSTPGGTKPQLTMPAWGDQKKLTDQQIADVIAFVLNLNK